MKTAEETFYNYLRRSAECYQAVDITGALQYMFFAVEWYARWGSEIRGDLRFLAECRNVLLLRARDLEKAVVGF